MRVAYYERTGDAAEVLQVGDIATPSPEPGEVLVRIACSGVNPSDVKKRAGRMPAPAEYPRVIPHSDGAGVIEAVGEGIDPARVGRRVWLWNAQWGRAFGTSAAYCALPSWQAEDLPDGTSMAAGACLGIPAQTAWVAVHDGRPAPGRTFLVHGGAGAVGEPAIRIAAAAGARVIATVSGPEKGEIARAAGAEVALDYRAGDTAAAILDAAGGSVDHIIDVDFGANWAVDAKVLATAGSIAAYSAPSAPVFDLDYYAFAAKAARMRFVQVYLLDPVERAETLAGVTGLVASGQLAPRIAARYPLERIAEAHTAQEQGHAVGNILIDIS